MAYVPGPFNTAHVLIQWGGKLPGGETWSCSLRCAEQMHVPGAATVPPFDDVMDWNHGAIKDAVQEYHTNENTQIHPAAKLSFARANRIGTDGHYMDPETNEYVFEDLPGGGNAARSVPNQIALAVSLTTGYTRGPAHRGRFYLPMPTVAVGADGLIQAGAVDPIAATTRTFLEALADTPGIDAPNALTPSVMSRKLGAPASRKIIGVEIGRVLDTQRRRRRSLTENYVSQGLDLGGL